MCVCAVTGAGAGVPSLELFIEVRFLGEVESSPAVLELERGMCGKPPVLGRGL